MSCEKYAEYISALSDGELSSEKRRELAMHIKDCPDCEKRLSQIKLLKDRMSEMTVSPPFDLHEKIMSKIKKAEAQRKASVRKRIIGVCAAACLLIAFAVTAPNYRNLHLFNARKDASSIENKESLSESLSLSSETETSEEKAIAENGALSGASSSFAYDSDNTNAELPDAAEGLTRNKSAAVLNNDYANCAAFSGNAELPDDFGDKETEYDPQNNVTYIILDNEVFNDAVTKIINAGFDYKDYSFKNINENARKSLIIVFGEE